MTITAKYSGKCKNCGQTISVGEKIEWSRDSGSAHIHCPQKRNTTTPDPKAITISGGFGYGCRGWLVTDIVRNPYHGNTHWQVDASWRQPEYLYVVSAWKRYFRNDGMSFGVGDDQGYLYRAECRPATDEESAPVRAHEAGVAARKSAYADLEAIAHQIQGTGTRPHMDRRPAGLVVELKFYQNATNLRLYGGGEWFVIGDTEIWYIQGNGADGDDWSANNIPGAMAWMVPRTEEIANRIKTLDQTRHEG